MKKIAFCTVMIIIGSSLSACAGMLPVEPTATPTSTVTPNPTATITPSPTPTMTPSPTPTPYGGGSSLILLSIGSVPASFKLANGNTIQTSGEQLYTVDLNSGEYTSLISAADLSEKLGVTIARASFQPSPDGSWILVTASTEISMDTFDTADYYLVKADLTEWIPILDINAKTILWDWSPNSQMLVGNGLTVNRTLDVYVVNKDGTDMRKVNTKAATSPQFSMDSAGLFWLEDKKPIYYDLATGESTLLDPSKGSENVVEAERKLTALFVSPYTDLLMYSMEGVSIISRTDFSEGRVVIGSFDTSCGGKFPPSVTAWSPDGQYLVMKSYTCVKALGMLLPKANNRLIDVDDTFTSVLRPITPCGWSSDGYFTMIEKVDNVNQLSFIDMKSGETVLGLPWKANCPIWPH